MTRMPLSFAVVFLCALLAACAVPAGNAPPPPPGQIDIDTDVPGSTLRVGAGAATDFAVTVAFGAGFAGTVRIEHGDLPAGFSLLYGGRSLDDAELVLSQADTVILTLSAGPAPEDSDNLYFDVVAQGLDERGSERGQPRDQVGFSIVLE